LGGHEDNVPVTSFLPQLTGSFSTPAADNPTVQIMEAAYTAGNLDFRYINCDVKPDGLADAVRGAVAMGWRGFNCSLPHKVAVIDLIDGLAESAAIIGAVNPVVNDGGRLIGENTDGQGFLASLREVKDPQDTSIVVFGAGGAARAIAVECALAGARAITIVNRSPERGRELADLVDSRTPAACDYRPWTPRFEVPADADVVINATSIGFGAGSTETLDVDTDSLQARMVVADVMANPPMTLWLHAAQARGCTILTGLGMLVNQAAINGRLWTGVDLDKGVMHRELSAIFGLAQ
jgi:shikimate dehydrogenase